MKKNFLKFMLIAAIIMGMSAVSSAKEFKGVITYKISYPGTDIDPSMAAMMPKMATMTLKGNMSKMEISMGQMGRQITITDASAKTVTNVLDMMGQKIYYVQDEEELKSDQPDPGKINVEITDETKEIAGYQCTKAIVTMKEGDDETIFQIYFTEEIGTPDMNFDNALFEKIPGAMLEFEIETGRDMRMKMEAISVKKSNVSDSEFEVPEGFEKKTSKEIRQMMGGGM
jgi:GLPGLI family protein